MGQHSDYMLSVTLGTLLCPIKAYILSKLLKPAMLFTIKFLSFAVKFILFCRQYRSYFQICLH
jgi:hypothetical protein